MQATKVPPPLPLLADIVVPTGSEQMFIDMLVRYKTAWRRERVTAFAVVSISEDLADRSYWTVVGISRETPDATFRLIKDNSVAVHPRSDAYDIATCPLAFRIADALIRMPPPDPVKLEKSKLTIIDDPELMIWISGFFPGINYRYRGSEFPGALTRMHALIDELERCAAAPSD